jgi:hypothetical protein
MLVTFNSECIFRELVVSKPLASLSSPWGLVSWEHREPSGWWWPGQSLSDTELSIHQHVLPDTFSASSAPELHCLSSKLASRAEQAAWCAPSVRAAFFTHCSGTHGGSGVVCLKCRQASDKAAMEEAMLASQRRSAACSFLVSWPGLYSPLLLPVFAFSQSLFSFSLTLLFQKIINYFIWQYWV